MFEIDLEDMVGSLDIFEKLSAENFPNTLRAFQDGMAHMRNYWADVVTGNVDVPGVHRRFWSDRYKDSILSAEAWNGDVNGDPWHVIIEPDQHVAHWVEDYIAPYDMKPGVLGGPNALRLAHTEKGPVRYKHIPFRHTSPKSGKKSAMPQSIYDLVEPDSGRKPMITAADISIKRYQGGKLQVKTIQGKTIQRGDPLTREDVEKAGHGGTLAPDRPDFHPIGYSAPIYEGMVRVQKEYETATQSQYMTWRTMSDNSDPGSWWHPGFEENPILDHVEEKAYEVLEEQIAAGLERDYAQIIEGK